MLIWRFSKHPGTAPPPSHYLTARLSLFSSFCSPHPLFFFLNHPNIWFETKLLKSYTGERTYTILHEKSLCACLCCVWMWDRFSVRLRNNTKGSHLLHPGPCVSCEALIHYIVCVFMCMHVGCACGCAHTCVCLICLRFNSTRVGKLVISQGRMRFNPRR